MQVLLMFLIMLALLFLEAPVYVSLAAASLTALLMDGGISVQVMSQRMFTAVNTFSLLALPFFMLAGTFMEQGGLTEKMVRFASSIVGWLKGGMSYVSVVAGMIMGGISGACTADTAALSALMIPTMKKEGYDEGYAAALQAASGCLGLIIPPSVPMILMGGITGISVAKLFVAGIGPGILCAIALMVACKYSTSRKNVGSGEYVPFSFKNIWASLKDAALTLLAPIIIIGGIISGIFTATESSVIAAVYTFLIGTFVYKQIKLKDLPRMLFEAGRKTGTVMIVVAGAGTFSWMLTYNNVHKVLTNFIFSITTNPALIVFLMMLIFFVLAMFIDESPLIIMLLPIMLPIAKQVGIDPMLFCILMVINNAIGGIMPPVGAAVFVAAGAGGIKTSRVNKHVFPFVVAYLVCMVLIFIFPDICLWLPNHTA